ncbi:tRNA lysidine(34) synthetase TilS [Pseudomonas sp. BGr12]|uniref:tRNA lysidine(34) synthetase TilS n=1 Tax=unclassified Pseudomonas TaxID=196821 RepID=UPI00177AC58C|nr:MULTISPECIES: tRNA lysidine(34) synthetase TilS [unclassified Pseudomonas]MBD9503542.1 tRNA lysidine(34) synthetase TilS [Pseudomonas sp. PDM17]MDL2425486.1 tRNA lysidine(34) synthetase TilS [Pseudomonas sp. BJa5]
MSADFQSRLLTFLAPWRTAPAWRVALSGGLDSTVLLHLLAQLAAREALPPISAIHVHHGLQAVADAWPEHCQRFCDSLGVPMQVARVQVDDGASQERAAREARYAAFAAALGEGECLLTGQHRDDQAETVLFRLLRGAGVRGLSAMAVSRPFGVGMLLRPLLGFSRAELERYAHCHGLIWVEDPSNASDDYDRNYLRNRVLPGIVQRWPSAVETIARSAEHLAEADGLLGELAQSDLISAGARNEYIGMRLPSLAIAALVELSEPRQRNALRHWLAPLARLPDSAHWAGWRDLRDAREDAEPIWRLADGELRRAHGRLWWLANPWLGFVPVNQAWHDPSQPLSLPENGSLHFEGEPPDGPLEVRYRQGGEVMLLAGRGSRDLKRLLNEAAVPAFLRGRLPLLWRADELLGVALLPDLRVEAGQGWTLRWTPPTNDSGLS